MITQKQLKESLHYNSENGQLTWIKAPRFNPNLLGKKAGRVDARGYLRVGFNNKKYPAHRLIWLYVHGEFPKKHIDHINGIRTDNRIINLREVSVAQNRRNSRISKNNSSGITGVYFNKKEQKWKATMHYDYAQIHLGTTEDFFEACCMRKSAERKYGFHENHGRQKNV